MIEKKVEDISDKEGIREIAIERVKSLEQEKETIPTSFEKEKDKEKTEENRELDKDSFANKIEDLSFAAQNSSSSVLKKREEAIDKILAEGLSNIFLQMEGKKQVEFKEKGEETAKKINILLTETKLKVNKIVDLIRRWLKLIPGVNKFFIEQEAKLKTDKIIKIKNNF